jgi:small subunit ribosomal protein S25e
VAEEAVTLDREPSTFYFTRLKGYPVKSMGSAKKRSLKQMERQQTLRTRKQQQEPRKRKSNANTADKRIGGASLPGVEDKELIGELSKMKAITPYMVASRYDVRLSVAKNLLGSLQRRGLIQLMAGNSNLKLYQFTG